jgi:hypothetical protein
MIKLYIGMNTSVFKGAKPITFIKISFIIWGILRPAVTVAPDSWDERLGLLSGNLKVIIGLAPI